MAKVNIQELGGQVKDPLLSDNFELLIPNPPVDAGNAAEALRIQCKTGTKPGLTIEEVMVEAFGHALRHAGKVTFSGSFSVEYNENKEMAITTILEQWAAKIRAHDTQLGSFKAEYATDAEFIIYKQDGSVAKKYKILGVWPKSVPELSFDGGAQAIPVQAEFSFDYYEEAS